MQITRKVRARAGAVACAACLAIAMAACGGSEDEDGGEEAGDPRASYIATVDEICARTTAEIDAATQERLGDSAPSTKELEEFVTGVSLPRLEEQYREIGAVEPPEGDEEEIQGILDAAESAIAEAERDPSSIVVVAGEPTPFDELNGRLAEYGFEQCGPAA